MKAVPIASLLAILAAGCGQEQTAQQTPAPDAGQAAAASIPAGLFSEASAGDAPPLREVKSTAQAGENVTFAAYIGGRARPFTDGRAVFLVADTEMAPPCTDSCPVPWDACCTPSDQVAGNSATVQVLDESGQILRLGLEGQGPLASGAEIVVTGTVREVGDRVMIVDAVQISPVR